MRKSAIDSTGRDAPGVTIAPPLRCFHRGENAAGPICGELARWSRPGAHWFSVEYFCDVHRGPADIEIAPEHVFRRVRFNVDVLLAAAHINAPMAHTEALARLERAVKSAGGVLDVNSVSSNVVRSCPQAPVSRAIARPDTGG